MFQDIWIGLIASFPKLCLIRWIWLNTFQWRFASSTETSPYRLSFLSGFTARNREIPLIPEAHAQQEAHSDERKIKDWKTQRLHLTTRI
jgi:hypothetical protein